MAVHGAAPHDPIDPQHDHRLQEDQLPIRNRSSIALLALLVVGACSARPESRVEQVTERHLREALLLSSAPAPVDRSCHIRRDELPPADRLVDSVAVSAAIGALEPSTALLSIRFDTLGAAEFVRIIEADGAQAERLAEVAERQLREQPESGAWRLKLASGPEPMVRVGYSEMCPPNLLNDDEVSRVLWQSGIRDPGRTVVRFKVGPAGRALETRVPHHTGEPASIRAYRELGEHLIFQPALIDGHPTTVWASIRVYTRNPDDPGWSRGND